MKRNFFNNLYGDITLAVDSMQRNDMIIVLIAIVLEVSFLVAMIMLVSAY